MSHKVDTVDWEHIALEYQAGASALELHAKYGMATATVTRRLRAMGVVIRSRVRRAAHTYTQADKERIIDLYDSGLSMHQIADATGFGRGSIQRTLVAVGRPMRPRGLRGLSVTIPENPTAVAYFAGLLDGEGNIQKRERDHRLAGLKVAIYSTTPSVMDWLYVTFGGSVRWDHVRFKRRGWKPMGTWSVYRARDVEAVLEAAFPYLIIKRDVAWEALTAVRQHVYPERDIDGHVTPK